jgi:hypothetical protein
MKLPTHYCNNVYVYIIQTKESTLCGHKSERWLGTKGPQQTKKIKEILLVLIIEATKYHTNGHFDLQIYLHSYFVLQLHLYHWYKDQYLQQFEKANKWNDIGDLQQIICQENSHTEKCFTGDDKSDIPALFRWWVNCSWIRCITHVSCRNAFHNPKL